MKLELPEFARGLTKVERAFGELAVGSLVAVYSEIGTSENRGLLLLACGEIVEAPAKKDETNPARVHVLLAPLDDNGVPKENEFKVFFRPKDHYPFAYRFFELQDESE